MVAGVGPRPPAERWPMAQRGGGRQKEPQRRAFLKRPAKAVSGKSFPQPRRSDFRGKRTRWEVGACDQCVGRGRPSSDRVGGSPPGTIAGTGAPGGRSLQGHEDVHREVEETSGFGSRRDHQGARGGVGGTSQVGQRGGSVGGWIETSEFSAARADGLSEQPPPPAAPAELRACVQALQVERDDLRAEVARQNVEGRPRNARSLAVPSPDLVMGDNSVQFRSARNSSSVMETLIDQADPKAKPNHHPNPTQQSGVEAFRRSMVCGGSVLVKHRTRVLCHVPHRGGPRWILTVMHLW